MSSLRDLVGIIIPFEWPGVLPGLEAHSSAFSDNLSISTNSNLDDFIGRLMPMVEADGIAVAFRDGDGFVCRASAGRAPRVGAVVEPGVGLCGVCLQEGRMVVEQDLDGEFRSIVAVPVFTEDRLAGCLAAFANRADAFRDIEIETIVAVASHLGDFEHADHMNLRQRDERAGNPDAVQEQDEDDYLARIHAELYPRTRALDA